MNSDPTSTISSATTILLIDDDRILQHILSGLLKAQGCQVLTATDGSTGLELARRHRPQLVLCDWSMAGMDGLEVCRRFKQDTHLAAIYFILLTSRSSLVERVEGLAHGLDRGSIGRLLVTTSDQLRCSDSCSFGDAHHLKHEDAVERIVGRRVHKRLSPSTV